MDKIQMDITVTEFVSLIRNKIVDAEEDKKIDECIRLASVMIGVMQDYITKCEAFKLDEEQNK